MTPETHPGPFLNLSRHPSAAWSPAQRRAALELGHPIVDVDFPDVDPGASLEEVERLAAQTLAIVPAAPAAAMVMGEFTATVALVQRLQALGVPCLAATTRRVLEDLAGGGTRRTFEFVRFRPYPRGGVGPVVRTGLGFPSRGSFA